MQFTSVNTLPTWARGALVAVSALNCGESPDTVAPHSKIQNPQAHSGASSSHGETSAHAPLQASCAAAMRALPKRRANTPPATQLSVPTAMPANTHHAAASPCQRSATIKGNSTKNAYSSPMWPK